MMKQKNKHGFVQTLENNLYLLRIVFKAALVHLSQSF